MLSLLTCLWLEDLTFCLGMHSGFFHLWMRGYFIFVLNQIQYYNSYVTYYLVPPYIISAVRKPYYSIIGTNYCWQLIYHLHLRIFLCNAGYILTNFASTCNLQGNTSICWGLASVNEKRKERIWKWGKYFGGKIKWKVISPISVKEREMIVLI